LSYVAVAVVVVQMTAACSFSITGPGEKVLHNIIILSQEVLTHDFVTLLFARLMIKTNSVMLIKIFSKDSRK
jgi:hypothetical protein